MRFCQPLCTLRRCVQMSPSGRTSYIHGRGVKGFSVDVGPPISHSHGAQESSKILSATQILYAQMTERDTMSSRARGPRQVSDNATPPTPGPTVSLANTRWSTPQSSQCTRIVQTNTAMDSARYVCTSASTLLSEELYSALTPASFGHLHITWGLLPVHDAGRAQQLILCSLWFTLYHSKKAIVFHVRCSMSLKKMSSHISQHIANEHSEHEAEKKPVKGEIGNELLDPNIRDDHGDPHRAALEDLDDERKVSIRTWIAIFFLGFTGNPSISFTINTVFSVLVPISLELQGSTENVSWMASGWSLAASVAFTLAGQLSDFFGRRDTLLFGQIVLIIGHIIGATSQSVHQGIAAMVILGFGTGTAFV